MPYMDLEKKRAYDREWIRRKKLGLDTKIIGKKSTLSPDEQIIRNKINSKKYRDRDKNIIRLHFKDKCFICHNIIDNGNYHKKDGNIHPKGSAYIVKHKDEFIYACRWCHRFIHVLMNLTHWSWEQIEMFISKNRYINLEVCGSASVDSSLSRRREGSVTPTDRQQEAL